MARPVLHNCFLPAWVHRLANGAIGGIAGVAVGYLAMLLLHAPMKVLWLGVLSGGICTTLNPKRFTLVEGCAGEDGYDELDGSK